MATVRTTISLEQDAHEFAAVYAKANGLTLSAAVSELIRKAEAAEVPDPEVHYAANGLPMFPPTGEALTPEMVKKLEADEIE